MTEYKTPEQLNYEKEKIVARSVIRNRSKDTIPDGDILLLRTSGRAARQMISELNETLGMKGYEISWSNKLDNEQIEIEVIVPRHLILMLKLRWGNL